MRISDWSSDVCSSDLDETNPRPAMATESAKRRCLRSTGVRKDATPVGAKGDDIVRLALHACHLHTRRSHRHPRNGEPGDAFWMLGQHALHVGDRNMALKGHPVDGGGMTRSQV